MKIIIACSNDRCIEIPMLVRIIALATAIFLSACASDPVVEERTKTVEVPVPVPVPCFEEKDKPKQKPKTVVDLKTATTDQMAAALAADAENSEQYAREVEGVLIQCQQKRSTQP